MTHLGDKAAALVDGQLSAEAAERAAMHMVGCRPCRDAVELERLTKQRLASLSSPEPEDGFLAQLMAMAGPAGPLPPREERLEVVSTLIPPPAPNPLPIAGSIPGPATLAGRSAGTRPSGRSSAWGRRPGDTRPAGSAPARRTATHRPRLAAAVLAASVMVGAGVTVGGVAAAGATATGKKVVPAMDSFVAQHSTSILWGTTGSNR